MGESRGGWYLCFCRSAGDRPHRGTMEATSSMLLELSITDFAIIEQSSIHFEEGLNVLTGETGAGKSILLDALGAVLGQRVSSELVRTGSKLARIEVVFSIGPDIWERVRPIFDELGIARDDDGTVIVAREILANGRSSARLNGQLVTVATMNALGSELVDIHGQSDHLAILKTGVQRELLDRFAGLETDRENVATLVREWRTIRKRIGDLSADSREREQRLDLLRFQIDEIESAALTVGEDETLQQERQVLLNADRLRQDAMLAISAISGDESAAEIPTALSSAGCRARNPRPGRCRPELGRFAGARPSWSYSRTIWRATLQLTLTMSNSTPSG